MSNPSRETKFSGANGDREKIIFADQLTTSRIGSLTQLVVTLAMCDDRTIYTCMCVCVFKEKSECCT